MLSAPIQVITDAIDASFDELWHTMEWERRTDAPRYECWMNDFERSYTYGRGNGVRTYHSRPWHPKVREIRDTLNDKIGVYFEACFVNGYKDHRDHLGWHSDDSDNIDHTKPIAIISFGAVREIWFRPVGHKGGYTDKVVMTPGSVVLMGPMMQMSWEHRIPKHSAETGGRISLTFRSLLPE